MSAGPSTSLVAGTPRSNLVGESKVDLFAPRASVPALFGIPNTGLVVPGASPYAGVPRTGLVTPGASMLSLVGVFVADPAAGPAGGSSVAKAGEAGEEPDEPADVMNAGSQLDGPEGVGDTGAGAAECDVCGIDPTTSCNRATSSSAKATSFSAFAKSPWAAGDQYQVPSRTL